MSEAAGLAAKCTYRNSLEQFWKGKGRQRERQRAGGALSKSKCREAARLSGCGVLEELLVEQEM